MNDLDWNLHTFGVQDDMLGKYCKCGCHPEALQKDPLQPLIANHYPPTTPVNTRFLINNFYKEGWCK